GSYGFRPGRRPLEALHEPRQRGLTEGLGWIVEAGVSGYFDSIGRTPLRGGLRKRGNGGSILRLIGPLVRARGLGQGALTHPETGVVQGGVVSPPTKLQTFFFRIVITRIWVDPKHDIDLVTCDFHPLDQRPDEVALARPVGRLQAIVEFRRKVFQTANN